MPAVIGRKGVIRAMRMELDDEEKGYLEDCAKSLREVIKKAEGELREAGVKF